MTDTLLPAREQDQGAVLLRNLDDGQSYWQPVPANGFVRCLLNSAEVSAEHPFSIGTQTVAPGGCFVRTHAHHRHEEVIYFLDGHGRVEIDDGDAVFEATPGTIVYLGRNRRHSFINEGSNVPLTFLWLLMPSGIEQFFERIGKRREPGETDPEPFPRPDNIAQIEAETVFAFQPNTKNKD